MIIIPTIVFAIIFLFTSSYTNVLNCNLPLEKQIPVQAVMFEEKKDLPEKFEEENFWNKVPKYIPKRKIILFLNPFRQNYFYTLRPIRHSEGQY